MTADPCHCWFPAVVNYPRSCKCHNDDVGCLTHGRTLSPKEIFLNTRGSIYYESNQLVSVRGLNAPPLDPRFESLNVVALSRGNEWGPLEAEAFRTALNVNTRPLNFTSTFSPRDVISNAYTYIQRDKRSARAPVEKKLNSVADNSFDLKQRWCVSTLSMNKFLRQDQPGAKSRPTRCPFY